MHPVGNYKIYKFFHSFKKVGQLRSYGKMMTERGRENIKREIKVKNYLTRESYERVERERDKEKERKGEMKTKKEDQWLERNRQESGREREMNAKKKEKELGRVNF